MSSEIRFASCLGPALAQYLDLKVSVGLRFDTVCRVLLHGMPRSAWSFAYDARARRSRSEAAQPF
jgi:hypothetical protein